MGSVKSPTAMNIDFERGMMDCYDHYESYIAKL